MASRVLMPLSRTGLPSAVPRRFYQTATRHWHSSSHAPVTINAATQRPHLRAHLPRHPSTRSIFIQTSPTPNVNALKFIPNQAVLPAGLPVSYLEYGDLRSTLTPPYLSPLASDLLHIDGVASVFYGADFITISKHDEVRWEHIKPDVFSTITETITAGKPIVTMAEGGATHGDEDSLSYDPNDSEVVGMIKELLDTRIRPTLQADGGDIEYRGFENGYVLLKLKGACKGCDSSTTTVQNGVKAMLMHYISEVQGVTQVEDPEEEIAAREFARFEEKLKQQRPSARVDL